MDLTYKLFTGTDQHGSLVTIAIWEDELEKNLPSDFFKPNVKEIELSGTILISGDTNAIGTYFTMGG